LFCTNNQTATKLIRKHPNPEIANILIIAMTASAIQGDREKCLDSGMNNYLAKPVRAQTLKALLESYLNKEVAEKKIPNIEDEAKKLVKQALTEAQPAPVVKEGSNAKLSPERVEEEAGPPMMRSRPASVRSVTQRWLGSSGREEKSDATTSSSGNSK
jgi:response regulator RpfG family c-di-GMP phosphodiesterase